MQRAEAPQESALTSTPNHSKTVFWQTAADDDDDDVNVMDENGAPYTPNDSYLRHTSSLPGGFGRSLQQSPQEVALLRT